MTDYTIPVERHWPSNAEWRQVHVPIVPAPLDCRVGNNRDLTR